MLKIKGMLQFLNEQKWTLYYILFGIYLIVLSIQDLKSRRLKLSFLIAGFIFPAGAVLLGDGISVFQSVTGAAAGAVFFCISKVTKEAFGYGDSILIVMIGSFLGFWNVLSLLIAAFLMAAVFSVFLLVKRGFGRKDSFPFVPFIAAAYIGGIAVGIY